MQSNINGVKPNIHIVFLMHKSNGGRLTIGWHSATPVYQPIKTVVAIFSVRKTLCIVVFKHSSMFCDSLVTAGFNCCRNIYTSYKFLTYVRLPSPTKALVVCLVSYHTFGRS